MRDNKHKLSDEFQFYMSLFERDASTIGDKISKLPDELQCNIYSFIPYKNCNVCNMRLCTFDKRSITHCSIFCKTKHTISIYYLSDKSVKIIYDQMCNALSVISKCVITYHLLHIIAVIILYTNNIKIMEEYTI
jgi:hypothetical protein